MSTLESDVIDAARYLRSIRPIDPEELTAYTSDSTDAQTVWAILRRHALDLDLVERDDGTFIPVDDEALKLNLEVVTELPESLESAVEGRLTDRHGNGWDVGDTAMMLRDRIRELKARYLEGGSIEYDRLDADAYLLYHLPRSYAATSYVVGELLAAGVLSRSLRILDVGAGVGAHLFAIDAATPDDSLIDYTALEPSPLADHLQAIASDYVGRNTHLTVERDQLERFIPDGPYDLIILGNVISELSDPLTHVQALLDELAEDGSLIALAPADPRTSVQLRQLERELATRATIFAPTLRLWPHRTPTDDCWSFVETEPLAVPSFQRRLTSNLDADERREYRNVEVRFSYSTMRLDDIRRFDIQGDPTWALPLGDAADVIGDRVDLLVVKLSGDLAEGNNPLYRVGDGSQQEDTFATVVNPTPYNRSLIEAPYGSVLRLEGALILWNDDEQAINTVIDDESMVERLTS